MSKYLKIKDTKGIYYIDDGQVKVKNDFVVPPRRFKEDFKLWFKVTKMTNGKRVYRKKTITYPHNTTLASAVLDAYGHKRALQATINTNVTYKPVSHSDTKLNELFDAFLLQKKSEIRSNTLNFYKIFYNKHIKPSVGHKKLKYISKYDLNDLANRMRLNGYKERTVSSIKQILNPLFNQYVISGDITVNPAMQIELKKLNNEVEINLSLQQIKKLMKAINNYPIEPFRGIFVFLSTGRRLNEVLTLKWENIHIDERFFRITKENNKNSKANTYPLSDKLLDALPEPRPTGLIFHSIRDANKKMGGTNLRRHWEKLYKSVEIEHLRIHDLRHIIGNIMVSNGANLTEVAELLGHSNTTITRRYSKSETHSKKRSLDKFFDIVG